MLWQERRGEERAYRDDPPQTIENLAFIAAVEELLDLAAVEGLRNAPRATPGC
jgi:hypothetical protein